MSRHDTSVAAQARRRQKIWKTHNNWCRRYYDDNGKFTLVQPKVDRRTHGFHAIAWLGGSEEDVALANRILANYPLGKLDREDELVHAFSHLISAMLLCFYENRLTENNRQEMKRVLHKWVIEDKIFRSYYPGYNDNYPTMEALAILVAPRFFDVPAEILAGGLEILRDLARMHRRRGFISEYTSPTYSPITTMCLAHLVNFSPVEEASELALSAESRMWLEMASHWHPTTSSAAGPHSRAYWVDVCSHLHGWNVLFYHVFGETVFINPENHLFPYLSDKQIRHHKGCDETIESHTMSYMAPDYHVPDEAVSLAFEKPEPTTVIATSDYGAFPTRVDHLPSPVHQYQAGHTVLVTHHSSEFALGSARRDFLNGSPNTHVHLLQRRTTPAKTLRDIAATFSRYVIGDVQPDLIDRVEDNGRSLCLQHENTVMALYRAKMMWSVNPPNKDGLLRTGSLKLSLFTTAMFGGPDEVWIGQHPLENCQGESTAVAPVFVRNGNVYWVLHPLIVTDHGRTAAIRARSFKHFHEIALYNYEDESRAFSDAEICTTLNGFVLVAEEASDWPSFDAFRAANDAPEISDEWQAPRRLTRRTIYRQGNLELAMEISPATEGIRYATVNGEPAPENQFSVNGKSIV